jgi:putative membrane protein insertion efficiency factor
MAKFLKLLVRLYRNTVGITLPNSCRYQPTCSQYALNALTEYGAVRGTWLAVKRIARCHPLAAGGYDPVPPSAKRQTPSDERGQGRTCYPVPARGQRTKDKGRSPDFATERRTTTA